MANLFEQAKPEDVSFEEALACVDREIKMRRKVYPRWVRDKKLSQEAADRELMALRGVRLKLIHGAALALAAGSRPDAEHLVAVKDAHVADLLFQWPEPKEQKP